VLCNVEPGPVLIAPLQTRLHPFAIMSENTPPRATANAARRPMQVKKEGTLAAGNDQSSSRIAHTLTACCRCRNVGVPILYLFRARLISRCREKPDATQDFHVAVHASERTPNASTLTSRKGLGSRETMSSISSTRCGTWRDGSRSLRRTTSTRNRKTWCDMEHEYTYRSMTNRSSSGRQVG
jgi:hypothetical protein